MVGADSSERGFLPLRFISLFLLVYLVIGGASPSFAAGKLVAAILTSDLSRYKDAHRAFVKAMAQKGYDDRTIEIITQNPNPDPISWANAIRKFNAIGADIIITYGAPVTLAAMREAGHIPIVFVDVYDPVESGITRSMLAPGGNLTGISSKVPLITLVKAANALKPVRTMGVLYSSREVGSVVQLKEAKRIAAQLGLAVVEANILSTSGIGNALASFLPAQVDCIYVSESASASRGLEKIIRWANANKIPVVSQMPGAANKGVLIALEIDPVEQGQVAADYATKILGGKKPGQMSITTPKKIELIINMKTAKILGIHVPFTVLSEATKIIK